MDALTNLYERLRAQAEPGARVEPPSYDEWLKFWNDADSEICNLRNFQHWLSRAVERSKRGPSSIRQPANSR